MGKIIDFKYTIDDNQLNEIIEAIKNGELIVFPTETVYGIGANALDDFACKRIFEAKERPQDNPLIVHVSDKQMLKKYVRSISRIEQKLIDTFMPGPFTLILKKSDEIPNSVSAGLDTIGVRIPSNYIAHTIIEKLGFPIAAPSANISSRPSGTRVSDIENELIDKVSFIIDGGDSDIGIESTVVKVIDDIPLILRPGKVSKEDIERVVGQARVDKNLMRKNDGIQKVESPGMKHKHYAPSTRCVLVYFEDKKQQINEIKSILEENNKVCVIGFEEDLKEINAQKFINVGSKKNIDQVSKNIYTALRKADNMGCDLIVIEGVKKDKMGFAIMNRLIRACNYNIIGKI